MCAARAERRVVDLSKALRLLEKSPVEALLGPRGGLLEEVERFLIEEALGADAVGAFFDDIIDAPKERVDGSLVLAQTKEGLDLADETFVRGFQSKVTSIPSLLRLSSSLEPTSNRVRMTVNCDNQAAAEHYARLVETLIEEVKAGKVIFFPGARKVMSDAPRPPDL